MIYQQPVGNNWAQFTLEDFNLFDTMDNWVQPLVGTPEERAVKLRDPEVREAMQRDLDKYGYTRSNPDIVTVS